MDAFIARQPIFQRSGEVYGYELLFRDGLENAFGGTDLTHASSKVIADGFLLHGLEKLAQGKRVFINVTEEVLVHDLVQLFPREHTIVELMETLEPNPWTIEACRRLKRAGYVLALDDYRADECSEDLLDLADIVKIDVLSTPAATRRYLASRLRGTGRRLVAEKVETREVLDETSELGFDLFQGYFFCRPRIIAAQDVPAYKLHYFQVLQEIHRAELDMERIEEILKHEPSLCYKLLRYINSARFAWRTEVGSVRRALVLLGEREFRRWATLMILANIARDRPTETLVQAITRGRFCEMLAARGDLRDRSDDLFLLGVFSMLDAMLDRPLPDIVGEIALQDEVRDALLGSPGVLGGVLGYVRAYQKADWIALAEMDSPAGVDPTVIPATYVEALDWGATMFFASGPPEERRRMTQ